jgi:acyl carrier protein
MTIFERLADIFQDVFDFNKSQLTLESVPDDVPKWDSVGHMNLVARIEGEFGVQFEVDEIMEMSSVEKIMEILQSKGVSD